MFILDDSLHLTPRKGLRILHKAPGRLVALAGTVLGYADGDTLLDGETALRRLTDAAASGLDPVDFIRWTVGSFVLVVANPERVLLVASPAGPGALLVRRGGSLLATTDDAECARHAAPGGLNEMEALRYLCTKPAPSCPPLTTLFKRASRLPGGASAVVARGLETSTRFYIHEAPELAPASHGRFARIFEDVTRLSCAAASDRQLFATVSGGIDSATTLLAALATGNRPVPLHWRKSQLLSGTVSLLCEKLGLKPTFYGRNYFLPDPIKHDWDRAMAFYSASLGVIGFNQMLTALAGADGAYITGMAFGNILQVNAQMRVNFGEERAERARKDSRLKKPLRHLFTPRFIQAARQGRAPALLGRIARATGAAAGRAPGGVEEYLAFLAMTNELPLLPEPLSPLLPTELAASFAAYLRRTNFEDTLGPEALGELRAEGGRDVGDARVLRLARLLRFAHQVQRTSKNDGEYAKFGGFTLLSTPMEGPLLSYCMSRPVTREDVLQPKRDLFAYFRERAGFSYDEFLDLDAARRKAGDARDYGGGARPGEVPRKNEEILYETPDFRENYPRFVNPRTSALLQLLGAGPVRDALVRVYERNSARPEQFMLGNQLLNLEVFLRANA